MNQKGFVLVLIALGIVLITGIAAGAYYLGRLNTSKPQQQQRSVITSVSPQPSFTSTTKTAEISATIINGDIVVTKQGQQTKITSWGYNSDPVLSPDNTKVAYISKSKESLENEKVDIGYKRTSDNVWVINIDGANPIQLTKHIDFVYRGDLHWLDNDRLIFTDGEQSARIYSLSGKIMQTVMGPERAIQACLDACGYEIRYFYNNDYSYLMRLAGGFPPAKTAILNLKTLKLIEVNDEFGIDFDSLRFSPDGSSISFKGTRVPDYNKQIRIEINLNTGQINFKP